MMNEFKKLMGDTDDSVCTTALSKIISAMVIAGALIMSAIIIAASFLWGWVGFASVIAMFILTLLILVLGANE